jgi:hypothetical protein
MRGRQGAPCEQGDEPRRRRGYHLCETGSHRRPHRRRLGARCAMEHGGDVASGAHAESGVGGRSGAAVLDSRRRHMSREGERAAAIATGRGREWRRGGRRCRECCPRGHRRRCGCRPCEIHHHRERAGDDLLKAPASPWVLQAPSCRGKARLQRTTPQPQTHLGGTGTGSHATASWRGLHARREKEIRKTREVAR